MNEPFLPLPIPSPPESGFGAILTRVLGRVARWLRSPGTRVRTRLGRRRASRLAAGEAARRRSCSAFRFPVLPPPEF
jgi:hypothetical protein